jgi:tetratricopeptide (TPR) repeat protein
MKIPGYAAAVICLLLAVSQIYFSWMSSRHLRLARLELMKKNPAAAKENLHTSLNYQLLPPALYTAGAMELFNFRNPDEAVRLLEQIDSKLGLPGVYHSNALLGRAYALKQDFVRSIEYFDRELHYYPMSALASGLKLMVLRQSQSDSKTIFEENQRFLRLMQLRNLKPDAFSTLLRNQELDDRPLKPQKEE